ncbi:MAG: hypothetical protein GY838_03020 [bacterium]|nr:hypothetical protein [bacterium]
MSPVLPLAFRRARVRPLLVLCCLMAVAVAAGGQTHEPDTLQAFADIDTIPILNAELDWEALGDVHPDSALAAGLGVILAFEDTFTFAPDDIDTLMVTADAVSVDEIIEAVGRKMEAESLAMKDVEFTSLTTVVERQVRSRNGRDYKVTETAERMSFDGEGKNHSVRLWERTRTVENGEVVDEEVDTEQERDFGDVQHTLAMAMPFSRSTGHRYSYSVEDRKLVGNSLIYRIAFEPKSRFEALPSGTAWVDYSHWVLRRLDAEMTDVVPFPLFLKGIPKFRVSRERHGGYWFTTDMHLEVELRKIPVGDLPRLVEVRTQLRDIVINGEPVSMDMAVPERARHGNLDPDDFWLSPDASDDSLSAYWGEISQVWRDDLTSAAAPVALSEAKIDTLTTLGSTVLEEMAEASPWTLGLGAALPKFNRVQGPVVGGRASLRHRGLVRPQISLWAGYGISNQRSEAGLGLSWPLVRGRVQERPGADPDRAALELRADAWKSTVPFAGDDRARTRSLTSAFYGSDPNSYLESRGVAANLTWRPGLGLELSGGVGRTEDRALDQSTSWNALGRRLRPGGNLAAQHLDDEFGRAGLGWKGGPLTLSAESRWHRAEGPDLEAAGLGKTDFTELRLSGEFDQLDGLGNQWLVRGRHRAVDAQAPRQWRTYLGDYGTLRGYAAGELVGDEGTSASVDLRVGVDPLAALHVPVLRHWQLQPLLFADWGRTANEAGPWPVEGATGDRFDVGFGVGKRCDLPFALGTPNLRCYAARPVGEGSEGHGWRYLIAFEP